uniref:Secreted protein n=1 Tax=Anopheles funestus TaxID=62324 RepID=A0A182R9A5_ANOFN
MITHWTLVVLVALAITGPYSALARPAEPEAPAEIYNELAEEFQRLHNQEIRFLQYLSVQAERQQREEAYLQAQREQQQLSLEARNSLLDDGGSLLDDVPQEYGRSEDGTMANGSGRNLSGFGHEIATQTEAVQKEIPHQKSKNDKKNNHYMSLCHFKLCNMGRKRNQRFPQFWN